MSICLRRINTGNGTRWCDYCCAMSADAVPTHSPS